MHINYVYAVKTKVKHNIEIFWARFDKTRYSRVSKSQENLEANRGKIESETTIIDDPQDMYYQRFIHHREHPFNLKGYGFFGGKKILSANLIEKKILSMKLFFFVEKK